MLANLDGTPAETPTNFDGFPKSGLEREDGNIPDWKDFSNWSEEAKNNVTYLKREMKNQGGKQIDTEWWHWSFG